MEPKSQSLIPMLIVILVLSFALGIVGGSRTFLAFSLKDKLGLSNEVRAFYMAVVGLIGFVINPVLVFIGIYLIGRKIDLKANLTSIIVRLLVGAYVGNLFGHIVAPLVGSPLLHELEIPLFITSSFLLGLFSISILHLFFVAFTALSIAHIRRT